MTKQNTERIIALLRKQLELVPAERAAILEKIKQLEGK